MADLMNQPVVDSRSSEGQGIEDKLGSGTQIIHPQGGNYTFQGDCGQLVMKIFIEPTARGSP